MDGDLQVQVKMDLKLAHYICDWIENRKGELSNQGVSKTDQ